MSGSPLRWGISTGAISVAKRPCLMASADAFVARRGYRVLVGASDLVFVGVALRPLAHVFHLERAPQPVVDHGVDDDVVAQAVAGAGVSQEVRGVRHRLHAAGDDDVCVAGRDHLVGEVDRVDAG